MRQYLIIDADSHASIYDACKYFTLFQKTSFKGKCAVVTSYNPQARDVTLEETVTSGPGALLPPPIEGLSLRWRNSEALHRLASIAERRAG